ncbi:MAG: sulfite exporter TauE/SafE family protein [Chloroflexota bacterium]
MDIADIALALALVGVGTFAATYGSLVGAGGGFVVVPILIFLSPESSPALLTAISLTGILMTGLSGTWAYHRLGLIDYRSGLAFAVPGIPGAILGVIVVHQIDPYLFCIAFGALLLVTGTFLLLHPRHHGDSTGQRGVSHRRIEDRQGNVYEYRFNLLLGLAANFVVGILKALFGIGGGLIFTPFAIAVLGFPTLVATATSVFTLTFTTAAAVLSHAATGSFAEGSLRLLPVALGMAVGGQLGPRLARRVGGIFVVRLLAVTLMVMGATMVVRQLF